MKNNNFDTYNFLLESMWFFKKKSHKHLFVAREQAHSLDHATRILKIRTMTRGQLIEAISLYKEQIKRAKIMREWELMYEYEVALVYANNRRFYLKKDKGEK